LQRYWCCYEISLIKNKAYAYFNDITQDIEGIRVLYKFKNIHKVIQKYNKYFPLDKPTTLDILETYKNDKGFDVMLKELLDYDLFDINNAKITEEKDKIYITQEIINRFSNLGYYDNYVELSIIETMFRGTATFELIRGLSFNSSPIILGDVTLDFRDFSLDFIGTGNLEIYCRNMLDHIILIKTMFLISKETITQEPNFLAPPVGSVISPHIPLQRENPAGIPLGVDL